MHFWCEGAAVELVLMQMKYFLLLYTAVEPSESSHYEVAKGSATFLNYVHVKAKFPNTDVFLCQHLAM